MLLNILNIFGIVHRKILFIYLPSCHWKPLWLSFFCGTQEIIFQLFLSTQWKSFWSKTTLNPHIKQYFSESSIYIYIYRERERESHFSVFAHIKTSVCRGADDLHEEVLYFGAGTFISVSDFWCVWTTLLVSQSSISYQCFWDAAVQLNSLSSCLAGFQMPAHTHTWSALEDLCLALLQTQICGEVEEMKWKTDPALRQKSGGI